MSINLPGGHCSVRWLVARKSILPSGFELSLEATLKLSTEVRECLLVFGKQLVPCLFLTDAAVLDGLVIGLYLHSQNLASLSSKWCWHSHLGGNKKGLSGVESEFLRHLGDIVATERSTMDLL